MRTLYHAVPHAYTLGLGPKPGFGVRTRKMDKDIFEAICGLLNLVVAKLPQLLLDHPAAADIIPLLRGLAICFDRNSAYHILHRNDKSPCLLLLADRQKYAKPLPCPTKHLGGLWFCLVRKMLVRDDNGCKCSSCKPLDSYCWLSVLLDYFGQTPYGNGYEKLMIVLTQPQKLQLDVIEALLLPFSNNIEFLTDKVAASFLEPCNRVLVFLVKSNLAGRETLTSIQQQLYAISNSVKRRINLVPKKLVEERTKTPPRGSTATGVVEIETLEKSAEPVTTRDSPSKDGPHGNELIAKKTSVDVLKSYLHEKRLVDEAKTTIKFLIENKELSGEHLDVIWGLSKWPEQLDTAFHLFMYIVASFSEDQVKTVFSKAESSEGRSAAYHILKILSLVNRLSQTESERNKVSRLLKLLWSSMQTEETDTIVKGKMSKIEMIAGAAREEVIIPEVLSIGKLMFAIQEADFMIKEKKKECLAARTKHEEEQENSSDKLQAKISEIDERDQDFQLGISVDRTLLSKECLERLQMVRILLYGSEDEELREQLKTAEKMELTLLESMRRESLLALTFQNDITEIETSLHKMHRKIRRRHYKDLIELFQKNWSLKEKVLVEHVSMTSKVITLNEEAKRTIDKLHSLMIADKANGLIREVEQQHIEEKQIIRDQLAQEQKEKEMIREQLQEEHLIEIKLAENHKREKRLMQEQLQKEQKELRVQLCREQTERELLREQLQREHSKEMEGLRTQLSTEVEEHHRRDTELLRAELEKKEIDIKSLRESKEVARASRETHKPYRSECAVCFEEIGNPTSKKQPSSSLNAKMRRRACFVPCNHASVCYDCAQKEWRRTRVCPICKTKLTRRPIALPTVIHF